MISGVPPDAGPTRLEARVRGRVQGVGFRYFARREALRLGLTGWVANRPDGTVEVVAEGDVAPLRQLAGVLAKGPPGASIDGLVGRWAAPVGRFTGFEIRGDSHPGD